MRDALDLEATDRGRAALEELTAAAPQDARPREALSRLAYVLGSFENKEAATALLRRAQRTYPDDFWITHDLARALLGTGRADEAARYYTAAVALRPQSELVRHGLRQALRAPGRTEYATVSRPDPGAIRKLFSLVTSGAGRLIRVCPLVATHLGCSMTRLTPLVLTLGFVAALTSPAPAQYGKDKAAPAAEVMGDTEKAVLKLSQDK